jgi:hypothetical protein
MDGDTLYSIGDLARRTGLTVKTIRFYSDSGIVAPTGRSPAGYRRRLGGGQRTASRVDGSSGAQRCSLKDHRAGTARSGLVICGKALGAGSRSLVPRPPCPS